MVRRRRRIPSVRSCMAVAGWSVRAPDRKTPCDDRACQMTNRLKDKVAIVVGAGSSGPGWGNGKATAVAFAREGAKVLCVDINEAAAAETVALIKNEGGDAKPFTADVTKAAQVEAMTKACLDAHGRIDILDNNVGIAVVGSVVDVT